MDADLSGLLFFCLLQVVLMDEVKPEESVTIMNLMVNSFVFLFTTGSFDG